MFGGGPYEPETWAEYHRIKDKEATEKLKLELYMQQMSEEPGFVIAEASNEQE